MRVSFAGMSTDVPDGWRDESTLSFTMPDDERLAAPLGGKPRGRPAANVTLKWEPVSEDTTAGAYLDERLAKLGATLPKLVLTARGNAGDAAEALPFAEATLDAGLPLKQIYLARRVGAQMLVVTGTALPGSFAEARPLFVEVAAQARAEEPAAPEGGD